EHAHHARRRSDSWFQRTEDQLSARSLRHAQQPQGWRDGDHYRLPRTKEDGCTGYAGGSAAYGLRPHRRREPIQIRAAMMLSDGVIDIERNSKRAAAIFERYQWTAAVANGPQELLQFRVQRFFRIHLRASEFHTGNGQRRIRGGGSECGGIHRS